MKDINKIKITFVARAAAAEIRGTVRRSDGPITTGATVVAVPSTQILASTMPPSTALYSQTRMANSRQDGGFSLRFPSAGTYNLYAYQTRSTGAAPIVERGSLLGVYVSTTNPVTVSIDW